MQPAKIRFIGSSTRVYNDKQNTGK